METPGFREAVTADAVVTARYRGERAEFRGTVDLIVQCLRLALVSDAFGAHMLYRAKTSLLRRKVPVLPHLLHRWAMSAGQVAIGPWVIMAPGVYIIHGQVVIDGIVEIGSGVTIAPFVTIGLKAGVYQGPIIEDEVQIGTGAKLIGPIRIGHGAVIGANAVVVGDVEPGTTVAGVPARPR